MFCCVPVCCASLHNKYMHTNNCLVSRIILFVWLSRYPITAKRVLSSCKPPTAIKKKTHTQNVWIYGWALRCKQWKKAMQSIAVCFVASTVNESNAKWVRFELLTFVRPHLITEHRHLFAFNFVASLQRECGGKGAPGGWRMLDKIWWCNDRDYYQTECNANGGGCSDVCTCNFSRCRKTPFFLKCSLTLVTYNIYVHVEIAISK